MKRRRLAPWGALATIVVCAVVSAVVVGGPGLVGSVVGGVIVLAFFASTPAVLGPVAKATPALSLLFAMIFFLTKVVALFALFLVLRRSSDAIDPESVSVAVIATTLVWMGLRVLDSTRERTPIYDLPDAPTGDDQSRS